MTRVLIDIGLFVWGLAGGFTVHRNIFPLDQFNKRVEVLFIVPMCILLWPLELIEWLIEDTKDPQ